MEPSNASQPDNNAASSPHSEQLLLAPPKTNLGANDAGGGTWILLNWHFQHLGYVVWFPLEENHITTVDPVDMELFVGKILSPIEARECHQQKWGNEEKRGGRDGEREGWTEGSLKTQCVRQNRSVPSPRQPTAQAH